jgi:hypothetical protein
MVAARHPALADARLELRVPTESDLDEVASLAAARVHDPGLASVIRARASALRCELPCCI